MVDDIFVVDYTVLQTYGWWDVCSWLFATVVVRLMVCFCWY